MKSAVKPNRVVRRRSFCYRAHEVMKATNSLLASFIVVILISLGCSYHNDVNNRFGGIENATAIAKPDSIKAWRTVGSLKSSESVTFADFYQKAGKATLVPTNVTEQLCKILLDERSYLHLRGKEKSCTVLPGVILNFSSGKRDLDVFFCFDCNILIVRTGTDEKRIPIELNSDFDPRRPELVRMMKLIFPNDAQVQSLKEKR